MSRKATNEYIGIKRRAYAQAGRAKRMRILDDVCETTGYERKYANRLLTGNRKFREHNGRGKTYGDDVAEVLKRVWREAGCPCLPDFIGTNENAVKWQIWTGLLAHLLLHYLKFLSGWDKAFSRLVGIVRSAVWMDLDIVETLHLYGMASPPRRPRPHYIQQRLAGF